MKDIYEVKEEALEGKSDEDVAACALEKVISKASK
jgi:hypothetical protein